MKKRLRSAFMLHSKTPEFREKVEKSLKIIQEHYVKNRSYVSCSGGKDSLVLTHLCLKVDPDILVFHWDHGAYLMPREVEKDILGCIKALGVKNLAVRTSRRLWRPEARVDYRIWYRAFYGALRKLVEERGLEVCFLGFRAEESPRRKCRTRRFYEYDKATGVKLVYPIRSWTWLDVWAYIVSNNIKYPKVYDIYGEVLGYDKARLVTFFDMEFEKYGSPYIDGVLMWRYRHEAGF